MTRDARKKESAFDRKLKDIEREKRRLQNEIKSLSRAMKKGDVPPPGTTDSRMPPRRIPAPDKKESPSNAQEPPGELFAWNKDKAAPREAESPAKPLTSPLVAEKKMPVHGDERFSNYFSAGGLKTPYPARQERSIQKNKAIFMVVLVIVLGYIIFTVFIR